MSRTFGPAESIGRGAVEYQSPNAAAAADGCAVIAVGLNLEFTAGPVATRAYVDAAIQAIELTPGPQGPAGANGAQGPAGPNTVSGATATALLGILYGNGTNVAVASSANVISALGFTPANRAGDTFTGPITANSITLTNGDSSNIGIDVRPWARVRSNVGVLSGWLGNGSSSFVSGANADNDLALRAIGRFGVSTNNSGTPSFLIDTSGAATFNGTVFLPDAGFIQNASTNGNISLGSFGGTGLQVWAHAVRVNSGDLRFGNAEDVQIKRVSASNLGVYQAGGTTLGNLQVDNIHTGSNASNLRLGATSNLGGWGGVEVHQNGTRLQEWGGFNISLYARPVLFRRSILNGAATMATIDCETGAATFSGTVRLGVFTVATLPSASANASAIATVTDSSVTTNGTPVAGGGSNRVLVFSNGSTWDVVVA